MPFRQTIQELEYGLVCGLLLYPEWSELKGFESADCVDLGSC